MTGGVLAGWRMAPAAGLEVRRVWLCADGSTHLVRLKVADWPLFDSQAATDVTVARARALVGRAYRSGS